MQRLCTTQCGSQTLKRGSDDVVVRVLCGETPAGGLNVGPQHHGFRIFRVELAHEAMPQETGGPEHGDLHEEVHSHAKEKRQPRGKRVNIQPRIHGRADIFHSVRQGESGLKHGIRTRFHHVIAADADGVVFGHVLRTISDDVGHDPHGRRGRINIGVPGEVFLEDVILNCPHEMLLFDTLFFRSHNVASENGKHRTVHGHGHRHLIQGNLIKKNFHILDRIHRNPGFADITCNPGMIRIIAPVRGKVKGH